VSSEVHVAFDGAPRYDQVRIALRIHGSDVVVAIVAAAHCISTVGGCCHQLTLVKGDATRPQLSDIRVANAVLSKELSMAGLPNLELFLLLQRRLRDARRVLLGEQGRVQKRLRLLCVPLLIVGPRMPHHAGRFRVSIVTTLPIGRVLAHLTFSMRSA